MTYVHIGEVANMSLDDFKDDKRKELKANFYDNTEPPEPHDSFKEAEPGVPEWWSDITHDKQTVNTSVFDKDETVLAIRNESNHSTVLVCNAFVDLEKSK